jgi:hypothetical protein
LTEPGKEGFADKARQAIIKVLLLRDKHLAMARRLKENIRSIVPDKRILYAAATCYEKELEAFFNGLKEKAEALDISTATPARAGKTPVEGGMASPAAVDVWIKRANVDKEGLELAISQLAQQIVKGWAGIDSIRPKLNAAAQAALDQKIDELRQSTPAQFSSVSPEFRPTSASILQELPGNWRISATAASVCYELRAELVDYYQKTISIWDELIELVKKGEPFDLSRFKMLTDKLAITPPTMLKKLGEEHRKAANAMGHAITIPVAFLAQKIVHINLFFKGKFPELTRQEIIEGLSKYKHLTELQFELVKSLAISAAPLAAEVTQSYNNALAEARAELAEKGEVGLVPLGKKHGLTEAQLTELAKEVHSGQGAGLKLSSVTGLIPKVYGEAVGILRTIPDIGKQYKELFAIKDNEIAAVDYYPTSDPTLARPMAIITAGETAGLSHAEVRARFWGIPHVTIAKLDDLKKFNGKWIYLKVAETGVEFRLATEEEIANYESYKPKKPKPKLAKVDLSVKQNILEWTHANNPDQVSHKFASLHNASSAATYDRYSGTGRPSIAINWGSVIPYATYKRVLDSKPGLEDRIRAIIMNINNEDIDDIEKKLAEVRSLIENIDIPEGIWGNAENEREGPVRWNCSIDYTIYNDTYNGNGIFIRTGTNAEDLPDYPGFGAGQYGTLPNVMRKDAKDAVRKAWASIWNTGAYIERQKLGVDHFAVYPAIQITKALPAKYSFVVHTANPDKEDLDTMVIEIAQGLGEGLVGDKYPGKPHRYIYSKSKDAIIKFEPADKKEKAVLNPQGGLMRASTDYTDDIFIRDKERSDIALSIARSAIRVEKKINRPQDIEGAILQRDAEHKWCVVQSRSQVGYNVFPTPWDEYVKTNHEWAVRFLAKHRRGLDRRLPTSEFKEDVQAIFKEKMTQAGSTESVSINIANRLRLLSTLGEESKNLAGRCLICGAGIHNEMKAALQMLPLEMRSDLLARAATEYDMLDKQDLAEFMFVSNYNVARIIMTHPVGQLQEIFGKLPARSLSLIMSEVVSFYMKPKAPWEKLDMKISWNDMLNMVKSIYDSYGPDQKKEFDRYMSDQLSFNLAVSSPKERYVFTEEDRKRLFDRYYNMTQAIVLSASTIDGSLGLGVFFTNLMFINRGKAGTPFRFFLIMDIPERQEDFLRRNHLIGSWFDKILSPSEIDSANIVTIINHLVTHGDTAAAQVGGDEIAVAGSRETIARYVTPENNVIGVPVEPQRGKIPLAITDSIRAITERRETNENRLSAWLVSRGLDGTTRYHAWVYEAERMLETCEKSGVPKDAFAARLKQYGNRNTTNIPRDELDKSIAYMLDKNAAATADIILNSVAVLWAKDSNKVKAIMRGLGFKVMYKIRTHLPPVRKDEDRYITAARDFFNREALFPHSAKELEELLAACESAELASFLDNLYRYYVIEAANDSELPRDAAEKAIAAGFCRNSHMRSEYEHGLTDICKAHPEYIAWLSPLIASYGPGYEIVTEDKIKRGGSADNYRLREKLKERELRAMARRERMMRGEKIEPATLTDEDFKEWSVETAGKYNYEFYSPGRAYGEYQQTYYPDDFLHYMSYVGTEYSELWAAQDLIECMYREDEGYDQKPRIFAKDDIPLASVTLCLAALLELQGRETEHLIFEAAPPKLIADMVHYAAQSRINEKIKEFTWNDPPKIRLALERLINTQNNLRRAAIEGELSPQAKAFLAPAPKKISKAEVHRQKRAERKEIARMAMLRRELDERRKKGDPSPRTSLGRIMVHELMVRGDREVMVVDNRLGKDVDIVIKIDEAIYEADSGNIWVDDERELHLGSEGIEIYETTKTALSAQSEATPASEREHAVGFDDAVKFVQGREDARPLIVAVGKSWMKGYEEGKMQFSAINPLISALANYRGPGSVTVIIKDDEKLLAEIKAKMGEQGYENARIVALAGVETITKDLAEFANGKNVLVGVDNRKLTEDSYIRIMEMLKILMQLAISPDIKPDSPNIPMEKRGNFWVFIPHAEPMNYERLKPIYAAQRSA